MSEVSVILMSEGWQRSTRSDGSATGTRIYWSASCRPDKTPVTLPNTGDAWGEDVPSLFLQEIKTTPLGGDSSKGFAYECQYSSGVISTDPLGSDPDNVTAVTISTGATHDVYNYDRADGIYKAVPTKPEGSSYTFSSLDAPVPMSVVSPSVSISVTSRYTGSLTSITTENVNYCGKVNSVAMLGVDVGCVLFTGATATPVKDIDSLTGNPVITWNVTRNYQVRYIKGITRNTWQAVFVQGQYIFLSTAGTVETLIAPYAYANFPSPVL